MPTTRTPRLPSRVVPSRSRIQDELRRIPRRTRAILRAQGLDEDLTQEIQLALLTAPADATARRRHVHAAAERFRYHEVVRPRRRMVPESEAPAAYHSLVYGSPSRNEIEAQEAL